MNKRKPPHLALLGPVPVPIFAGLACHHRLDQTSVPKYFAGQHARSSVVHQVKDTEAGSVYGCWGIQCIITCSNILRKLSESGKGVKQRFWGLSPWEEGAAYFFYEIYRPFFSYTKHPEVLYNIWLMSEEIISDHFLMLWFQKNCWKFSRFPYITWGVQRPKSGWPKKRHFVS